MSERKARRAYKCKILYDKNSVVGNSGTYRDRDYFCLSSFGLCEVPSFSFSLRRRFNIWLNYERWEAGRDRGVFWRKQQQVCCDRPDAYCTGGSTVSDGRREPGGHCSSNLLFGCSKAPVRASGLTLDQASDNAILIKRYDASEVVFDRYSAHLVVPRVFFASIPFPGDFSITDVDGYILVARAMTKGGITAFGEAIDPASLEDTTGNMNFPRYTVPRPRGSSGWEDPGGRRVRPA